MKNLLLPICLLMPAVCLGQTYEDVIGDAAVEGHWKLQDNAATTTVVNEAGTDATITTASTTSADLSVATGPTSWLPRAFDFPGTSMDVAMGSNITLTSDSTISWWINKDVSGNMAVVGQSGSSANRAGMDGTSSVRVSIDGTNKSTSQGTDPTGVWHHYSVVIRDGEFDLYRDGAVVSTANGPIGNISNGALFTQIGHQNNSIDYINGRLAEVIIHSKALSADEVNALYSGPSSGPAIPLIHHYRSQMSQ